MKNKIFVGLAIIILIGIVIVSIFGFKVDICYKAYNIINMSSYAFCILLLQTNNYISIY